MTLYNQTEIVIYYTANEMCGMLAAGERIEVLLPEKGALCVQLRLPYGSMSQKIQSGRRWLDRILHRSGVFEDEWDFAIVSEYTFGEVHEGDEITVTRLKEAFGDGVRYECLLAACSGGILLKEHHEVPDAAEAIRKDRKGFRRFLLLTLLIDGGLGMILLWGLLAVFYLLEGKSPEALVALIWGSILIGVILILEVIPDIRDLRSRPRLSKALKNEAIIRHFRRNESAKQWKKQKKR